MPLRDDELESAARALRIELGIDDQLRPDMITVVVKLKKPGKSETMSGYRTIKCLTPKLSSTP
jgi:hypothetical protein